MNCVILEDQAPAQRILKKYIEDSGILKLEGAFNDPMEARVFLQSNQIDLLFLDVNLPKINGLSLLRSLTNKPKVILTTAYPEFALEGYELDVIDYLLKPFSFERFLKAVSKARGKDASVDTSKSEHFIKIGYDYIRISFEEIIYLEADGDYCQIHLKNKKHTSSDTLKKWMEMLDSNQFRRIHKSFVINRKKVQRISGSTVIMENGAELPIGRVYKEDFLSDFLS